MGKSITWPSNCARCCAAVGRSDKTFGIRSGVNPEESVDNLSAVSEDRFDHSTKDLTNMTFYIPICLVIFNCAFY